MASQASRRFSVTLSVEDYERLVLAARGAEREVAREAAVRLRRSLGGSLAGAEKTAGQGADGQAQAQRPRADAESAVKASTNAEPSAPASEPVLPPPPAKALAARTPGVKLGSEVKPPNAGLVNGLFERRLAQERGEKP